MIAAAALTPVAITSIVASFEESKVGFIGYTDLTMDLAAEMLITDYLQLAFSEEFVRENVATALTCNKVTGGVVGAALTCTPTYTAGRLETLKVEGLCPCSSGTTVTIRLNSVENLLETKAFAGTLAITSHASATESIGSGSFDLTTVPTLSVNTLTSCEVVRALTTQGAVTTFTISFDLPGKLLDNSEALIGLPKD